mmetsp:Transcript_21895/g.19928  ORF Transcript_21895/g.19928 Transcript_21895/m.19928 type:complete len:168 (+) Transcript_21895:114-617(+)
MDSYTKQELISLLLVEKKRSQEFEEKYVYEKSLRIKAENILSDLRKKHGELHQQVEREDENFVNKLINKIMKVKDDKEKLKKQLLIEEEYINENLVKQLQRLKLERQRLENEISVVKDSNDHIKKDNYLEIQDIDYDYFTNRSKVNEIMNDQSIDRESTVTDRSTLS